MASDFERYMQRYEPKTCEFCDKPGVGYVYLADDALLVCVPHAGVVVRARREIGEIIGGTAE